MATPAAFNPKGCGQDVRRFKGRWSRLVAHLNELVDRVNWLSANQAQTVVATPTADAAAQGVEMQVSCLDNNGRPAIGMFTVRNLKPLGP